MAQDRVLSSVLLSFILFSCAIHGIYITTSDFEEVYSGPGGQPEKEWSDANSAFMFHNQISVADFVFTGTRNEELYYERIVEAFSPPVATVVEGNDIIDPILMGVVADGYYFEPGFYWEELPTLSVYFNCQKDGEASIQLSIDASLAYADEAGNLSGQTNETIKFYFRKVCENPYGTRVGFSIGKDREDDVVKHGAVQHKWMVESYYELAADPVVVPESEHLSVFHISISSPAYGNQYYEAPVVYVEDDDLVEVNIRGNARKGGVASGVSESIVLVYDCIDNGDTDITVAISLGFFGTLRFGFTKVCTIADPEVHSGGGVINVGTSRSDYAGVVSESVTSLFWSLESNSVEIDYDAFFTNFYVSTLSGQTQAILKPVISVDPAKAFKVTTSGTLRDGGLLTGSPQHFTVNYICDHVAEAEVIVTIKLPGFKSVEFAYMKKCKTLKRHTDHVWTANQVMVAFVLCVIAIAIASYCLIKKKAAAKSK